MQDKKKRLLRGGGRLIALVLLGAVLFAAPWAAETAVTDVKEKLRGPQPEWTGVLSAGIVPSFPTVNLNGWLAARSREFEKQQGCVLLTLREMTAQGVKAATAAQNLPDLLFFGQGVLDDPAALLLCMETEVSQRAALQNVGVQNGARYAVPLAAGAYGLLGDVAQLDAAGWTPQMDAEQTLRLCAEKKLAIACPLLLYTSPESALRAMEGKYQFDLIFMDPPYRKGMEQEVLRYLAGSSLLKEDTVLIVEAALDTDFSYLDEYGMTLSRLKMYKTNEHAFIRRK